MSVASKSSVAEDFRLYGGTGQEEERALIARNVHQVRECLNAASFAIELAKTPDAPQTELVSRASKLLTEAMELLREDLDLQRR
jgi:signal transduction histidine kinase